MTRGGDYRKILRSRYRHYSISKCDEALAIAIAISSYITIYKAIAIAKKTYFFYFSCYCFRNTEPCPRVRD